MSTEQTDDFDDVPVLHPLGAKNLDDSLREDYRELPASLPKRKPGFGFWMAVAWALLYFVVTQVVAAIIAIPILLILLVREAGPNGVPDPVAWFKSPKLTTALLGATIASQFIGLGLSWLLLRLWCGKPWKSKIALTRLPTRTHAILVLIGFPAMIALTTVLDALIKQFIPSMQDLMTAIGMQAQMEGTTEAILAMVQDAPWGLAIFAVAVSPGICEEVFCRGFLAQGLSGRYQTWAVVAMVSFLFGCMHGDPQQGFGAMCLGLAIHSAYVATRSLPRRYDGAFWEQRAQRPPCELPHPVAWGARPV